MALFLDGDTFALFESKDLKAWTKLQDVRFPGHGECPDFFPMPIYQQMNFPCEMTLRAFPEGLRICRVPVGEIKNLYGKEHVWKDASIKPDENLLKDVAGGFYDIQLKVDLAGAKEFGIKCRGEAVT